MANESSFTLIESFHKPKNRDKRDLELYNKYTDWIFIKICDISKWTKNSFILPKQIWENNFVLVVWSKENVI